MQTEDTTWKKLVRGDLFICARSGRVEEVLFNAPNAKGRRFIRTHRHDHLEDPDGVVRMVLPVDGYESSAGAAGSTAHQVVGEWIETWTAGDVKASSLDPRMTDDLIERLSQKGLQIERKN